jgi:alkaline phosphatase
LILLIADGWGYRHIEAANQYTGQTPAYQSWTHFPMATFPQGGSYDPAQAWSDFEYVNSGATDSAAAATAMFTGQKTANGRITVSADGTARLFSLADQARLNGKAVGTVSSVYISHATPGAWYAHNDARGNGFAIADEGLWGEPNTTGDPGVDGRYAGGHGPSLPPVAVMLGAGHPAWEGGSYVNQVMRDKLAAESATPGNFTFVERLPGSPDGGARLLAAADNPAVRRLAGLFGGTGGNLEYQLADGSGANPENPTLAEMTVAALHVLNRHPFGFVLMAEGGAVDWAGHNNHMDRMAGELIAFNKTVQAVIDWVADPTNGSNWQNTLVVVTGDHETGYLTAAPDVFPNQPLGGVNPATLGLERQIAGSSRRASWDDTDWDSAIDPGETVYWTWNYGSHTNSLIPLYAKGPGAELFSGLTVGIDPERGPYIDNTSVFAVLHAAFELPEGISYLPAVQVTYQP